MTSRKELAAEIEKLKAELLKQGQKRSSQSQATSNQQKSRRLPPPTVGQLIDQARQLYTQIYSDEMMNDRDTQVAAAEVATSHAVTAIAMLLQEKKIEETGQSECAECQNKFTGTDYLCPDCRKKNQ